MLELRLSTWALQDASCCQRRSPPGGCHAHAVPLTLVACRRGTQRTNAKCGRTAPFLPQGTQHSRTRARPHVSPAPHACTVRCRSTSSAACWCPGRHPRQACFRSRRSACGPAGQRHMRGSRAAPGAGRAGRVWPAALAVTQCSSVVGVYQSAHWAEALRTRLTTVSMASVGLTRMPAACFLHRTHLPPGGRSKLDVVVLVSGRQQQSTFQRWRTRLHIALPTASALRPT